MLYKFDDAFNCSRVGVVSSSTYNLVSARQFRHALSSYSLARAPPRCVRVSKWSSEHEDFRRPGVHSLPPVVSLSTANWSFSHIMAPR